MAEGQPQTHQSRCRIAENTRRQQAQDSMDQHFSRTRREPYPPPVEPLRIHFIIVYCHLKCTKSANFWDSSLGFDNADQPT